MLRAPEWRIPALSKGEIEMRNMSFALTTQQVRDRTKDVTRRLGWGNLKPGERVQACVKCMGLKPGEKIERITVIECVSNHPECIAAITPNDVKREGFPEMNPEQFVDMFCEHMRVDRSQVVNRIEFKYID